MERQNGSNKERLEAFRRQMEAALEIADHLADGLWIPDYMIIDYKRRRREALRARSTPPEQSPSS